MILSDISYLESNELYTCLKVTEKPELEITRDTLRSVNVRLILTFDSIKVEKLLYKVKTNNIIFTDLEIIIKIELEEVHCHLDKIEIFIKAFHFSLISGKKINTPIEESYFLSEIQAEQFDYEVKELEKNKDINVQVKAEPVNISKIPKGKHQITLNLISPNKEVSFFEFENLKLVPSLEDIIENKEDRDELSSVNNLDLEYPKLDIIEQILEIIFSQLKLLYEFYSLEDLELDEILEKFFHKYFPKFFKKILEAPNGN